MAGAGSLPARDIPTVLRISTWAELVSIAFFSACAILVLDGGVAGWGDWFCLFVAGFFALTSVAALFIRPRLEVTEKAITEVGLISRKTFDLRRCGRFHAHRYMVRYARSVIAFPYDGRNARVEPHGHDAETVAELLNRARDHARRT